MTKRRSVEGYVCRSQEMVLGLSYPLSLDEIQNSIINIMLDCYWEGWHDRDEEEDDESE